MTAQKQLFENDVNLSDAKLRRYFVATGRFVSIQRKPKKAWSIEALFLLYYRFSLCKNKEKHKRINEQKSEYKSAYDIFFMQ